MSEQIEEGSATAERSDALATRLEIR